MNNIFSRKNIAASAIVLLMIAPAFAKAQIKNGQSKNLTAYATNPAKLNEMSLDEDWLACNALDGFQQKLTGTEKNLIAGLQPYDKGSRQHTAAKKAIAPITPYNYCANAQKNSIIKTLVDSLGMDPSISKKVQSFLVDGTYASINQVKAAYPECVFVGTVYKDPESYNAALDRFLRANKRAGTEEEQERLLNKFAQTNRVVYPEEAVYLVVPRPGGKGKGHATLLSDDQQFSFNRDHITPMPTQIRNASIIYLEQFLEALIRDEIRRIKDKPEDALKQSLTPLDDKYLEDIVRNMGKQDLIKLQIIKLLGKEVKVPEIRTGGAPVAFNAKTGEQYARDYLASVQRNQVMAFENSRGGRVG